MKIVKEKGYAKVNLFLDVVGVENGFHNLDSVVVTIDLFDLITLTKRKDKLVTIKQAHSLYRVEETVDNNAVRAGRAFVEAFNTNGVDIVVKKQIPIGSGLGGSSADISAVLRGMAKLYEIKEDIKPIADSLGSDSGYLLTGGYARLQGRGDRVEPLNLTNKLYMVIVTPEGGVNTGECFKLCDQMKADIKVGGAKNLIEKLKAKTYGQNDFYNALYSPACKINGEVEIAYNNLKNLSPRAVFMSGSGASIVGIFDELELCKWAEQKLKRLHRNVFITQSLTVAEINKPNFFTKTIYN